MRVAKLVGLAGRMKRIAEQHEARERQAGVGGRDLRRDAAAHRFPADEERVPRAVHVIAHGVDDGAVAGFEHRRAIGQLALLLGVEKVEGDDVGAERGQRVREARS